jgi:hypothetical protein
MDTEFRFLEQLEKDLQVAAARQRAFEAAPLSERRRRRARSSSAPHRSATWGTIAASIAILLVVAGAIGGLSQVGRDGGGALSAAFDAAEAPAGSPTSAPRGGRVKDLAGFDTSAPGIGYFAESQSPGGSGPAVPGQDLTKIVRDGAITIVVPVDGFGESFDRTTAIANDAGGFVLSSSISQERQGTLVLRVPAAELDGAVVRLRELGRLAELSLSGRDVTAEYIDLRSRLGVLKTQRDLILELLNEATTVSGTLGLSNRYTTVQTQIERLQGSLNVINDQVDLATLTVTLREDGVTAPIENDDVRSPSLGSAWDRAQQGFFSVIAAVVVGLGYLIPLLALACVVLLVRGGIMRRRAAS